MVRNMLVVDPRSMTPLVRVMVPAGRSISIGLPLLEVMALAALTASRRVAQEVPEQAAGDASSPVVVTVNVVIDAWAGACMSARPTRRNKARNRNRTPPPTPTRSRRRVPRENEKAIPPPVPPRAGRLGRGERRLGDTAQNGKGQEREILGL
jgi:hypothetical protein